MSRAAWIFLFLLVLSQAGCHLGAAWRSLIARDARGQSDLDRLIHAVPAVVAAPTNPFPWVDIGSIVATFIVGAITGDQTRKRRERKKSRLAAGSS